jgi:hypothetical protein
MKWQRPPHGSEGDAAPNPNQRPSPRTIEERHSHASDLSLADRTALIECGKTNGLHKDKGVWRGSSDGKPISGNTVANLGRDGLMIVTKAERLGSARLTERGERLRDVVHGT